MVNHDKINAEAKKSSTQQKFIAFYLDANAWESRSKGTS